MQHLAQDVPAAEKLRAIVLSAGDIMAADRALFSLYFETFRARQLGVVEAHAPAFAGMFDGLIAEAQAAGDIRADVPARLVGEYLQAVAAVERDEHHGHAAPREPPPQGRGPLLRAPSRLTSAERRDPPAGAPACGDDALDFH